MEFPWSNTQIHTIHESPDVTFSSRGQKQLSREITHVIQQSRGDMNVSILQRACRSAVKASEECTAQGGDVTDFGRSSNDLYLFKVGCDEFQPGEEARLTGYIQSLTFSPGEDLHVHGFASKEGNAAFNDRLSCARAIYAREVIRGAFAPGSAVSSIYVF